MAREIGLGLFDGQPHSALSCRWSASQLRGAYKYNAKDGKCIRLRQNPDIEASELNGELLLFNGTTNKFFVMNRTAAFVWERVKQPTSEQELAAGLCQSFTGTTEEEALVDVRETLKNMRELGLLLEQ